jgi:hypothetical protein
VPQGAGGTQVTTIEEAREVFCKYLYLPDPDVVDVVHGVVAGNQLLDTDPLWLMLKGPPGSGKTELLSPLQGRPEAEFVSNLTSAALISGYGDPTKDESDWSLLPQLDGRCMVVKDFTTILSMNPMQRDEIYGILRDAYDGHASKAFGTGKRQYKSKFNLLAGVTNAIEKAWHLSALGERFLTWGMAVNHREQAKRAMRQNNREMKEALARAAAGVLDNIPKVVPAVGVVLQSKTLLLAHLLARLRTFVARDRNDVVHVAPDVEVPTRIVKQLLRLGQSVALVRRKPSVTSAEFKIMRKVALDSVPSARLAVFNELVQLRAKGKIGPIDYFAEKCRISHSPARRHLDDMVLLGLAGTKTQKQMLLYKLSDEVWGEWQEIGPE